MTRSAVLGAWLVAGAVVVGAPAARAQDPEVQQAAALLDGLGLPDTGALRFVELNVGLPWPGLVEPAFAYERGWLLAETEAEIELLGDDLERRRWPRRCALPREWETRWRPAHPAERPLPGEWRALDADAEARTLLAEQGRTVQAAWGLVRLRDTAWDRPEPFVRALLHARWARERGATELAGLLLARVRVLQVEGGWAASLPQATAEQLGAFLAWHAVTAATRGAPHDALARAWELVGERLPAHARTEQARRMAAAYRTLHAEPADGGADPVRRWLRGLPETRGERADAAGPSPVEEVVRLFREAGDAPGAPGREVVPALIDRIGDERPSRWASDGDRCPCPSHTRLLTVGTCAEVTLKTITGRWFGPSQHLPEVERVAEAQRAARAWWTTAAAQGPTRALLDAIATGGDGAAALARDAVTRVPAEALAAIERALGRPEVAPERADLISAAALVPGPSATDLLRRELVAGPPGSRIRAAAALRERGSDEGLATVVAAWEALTARDDGDPWAWSRGYEALTYLAAPGSLDGLAALTSGLERRAPQTRQLVALILGAAEAGPEPWERAVEALLAGLLEAREVSGATSFSSDSRVCDDAAQALAARWPARYRFEGRAIRAVRDRELVEVANVWRASRGLEPRAAPVRPAAPPGLAEVERLLVSLAPDDPAHAGQEALARQLACTITRAEVVVGPVAPSDGWRRRVEALRGVTLTRERLAALLTAIRDDPPAGAGAVVLRAVRVGDGRGVEVEVALEPPPAPDPDAVPLPLLPVGSSDERVVLGTRQLHRLSAWFVIGSPCPGSDDLLRAVSEALSGPPTTPFEVSVRLGPPLR